MSDIIPQDDTTLKRCYKCKQLKPRTSENFGPDKRTTDGFRNCCKTCRHTEYEEALARNPDIHKNKYQKRLAKPFEEQERLRAYQAGKMREYRAKWIPAGICTRCGVRPAEEGHRHCYECWGLQQEWAEKRRPLRPADSKRSRQKLREQVLEAYGGKCQCCGEATPEFLAVDHINNDGAEHRRVVNKANFYRWLRQQGFPKEDFQLLCHNCNFAKSHYEGGCPHQRHF